jgi:hypothetical protein
MDSQDRAQYGQGQLASVSRLQEKKEVLRRKFMEQSEANGKDL